MLRNSSSILLHLGFGLLLGGCPACCLETNWGAVAAATELLLMPQHPLHCVCRQSPEER